RRTGVAYTTRQIRDPIGTGRTEYCHRCFVSRRSRLAKSFRRSASSNFHSHVVAMWNRSSLKWCALVAIVMTLLSLLPQVRLWLARGSQWHGAYATVDGDEFLYSAYINALIDGRPRRNDPFTGRDDNPKAPLPESTFSIQFIPSFVIASLARVIGISASTAFMILIGGAGLLASIALFWLLLCLTRDNQIAAAGTIFVLCLGGVAAGEGLLGV